MADRTALRHPAVSVVIPTFERPRYTCEAIHSVLGQTFEDFEIVVVDDGSGDDTVARVKGFGDPRLAVVEIPHSGRPATVRNAGIERASGEYVAFLDSDDLWLPTKLERQLEVLAASGHGWARTGVRAVEASGAPHPTLGEYRPPTRGSILRDILLRRAAVNTSTVLVRRDLLVEIGGFDETFAAGEDTDLWFRLALRGPVSTIGEPLALWRLHDRHYRAPGGWRRSYLRTLWAHRRGVPASLRTLWLREFLRVGMGYVLRRSLRPMVRRGRRQGR